MSRRHPPELPTVELFGQPASRRERWRAVTSVTVVGTLVTLVVLAVAFEQLAATGVLLVLFLSFVLAYLIGPAAERLRHQFAGSKRGRPLSRGPAVLMIYGIIAALLFPVWSLTGPRVGAAMERMRVLVPQHTARFIAQVRATERWHEALGLPMAIDEPLGSLTRGLSRGVEAEARGLGAELTGIRRLVPWLSLVPVVAFLLLTRWPRFRRSTTRALPTPHLRWRGYEFLRNLNGVLAAYTRAQTLSAAIVATLCWIGFAALGTPYPGTLAIAAGLLEMVPVAGPLVVAVVATGMMPGRVVPVLLFLAALRLLQDYVIGPRLISRALHLHPLGVVAALWAGAGIGGVVGVCLSIPVVGAMQVTHRHWREYREIEDLVRATAARRSAEAVAPYSEP